jgi:hypothetical protein
VDGLPWSKGSPSKQHVQMGQQGGSPDSMGLGDAMHAVRPVRKASSVSDHNESKKEVLEDVDRRYATLNFPNRRNTSSTLSPPMKSSNQLGNISDSGTSRSPDQSPQLKMVSGTEEEGYEQEDDLAKHLRHRRKVKHEPGSKHHHHHTHYTKDHKKLSKHTGPGQNLKHAPIYCNCVDHCKQIVLDRILPLGVEKLVAIMYRDPVFWESVMKARDFVQFRVSPWVDERRVIEYGFPLKVPFCKYFNVSYDLLCCYSSPIS